MTHLAEGNGGPHAYVTEDEDDSAELTDSMGLPERAASSSSKHAATRDPWVDERASEVGPGREWRASLAPHHEEAVRQYETHSPSMTPVQRRRFREALSAAPELDGPVYRGTETRGAYGFPAEIEKRNSPGMVISFPRHTSTSTRPEVAGGFGSTLYELHGSGAKPLGNTLHEAIMPPGRYCVHAAEWQDSPTRSATDGRTMFSSPHLHVTLHPVAEPDHPEHDPSNPGQCHTARRKEAISVSPEHRHQDPVTWDDAYRDYARARPHAAAIGQAQDLLRGDRFFFSHHYTQPVGDPQEASRLLRRMLVGRHPRAGEAFVLRHPHPDRGTSNVVEDDGVPGVVLHPQRWNQGTLAHEAAHIVTGHETGRKINEPITDEDNHGPRFLDNFQHALMQVDPSGETGKDLAERYHTALGRIHGLDAEPVGA
jgi:hypothetical protein